MIKNKKILALSFGLAVVFSSDEVCGMKRKFDTFASEDDGDFGNHDKSSPLQKQIRLESLYNNNVEFSEQGTVRRVKQPTLSHSNNDNNVDDAHQAFLTKVENLVVSQADLNEQDADGNTFLHRAVLTGYKDIIKLLLDNGADYSISNNNGDTPFVIARNADLYEMMRFLMEHDGVCY